jgi:hypothetical protein
MLEHSPHGEDLCLILVGEVHGTIDWIHSLETSFVVAVNEGLAPRSTRIPSWDLFRCRYVNQTELLRIVKTLQSCSTVEN